MDRQELLVHLAGCIASLQRPSPVRVAIDGIDAAGKTTLANELVDPLKALGRHVIRTSLDGFHRPRAERYRQGADSPRGYYDDSFDYAALRENLLLPLGPGGSRLYRTAVFDHRTDSRSWARTEHAPENAILLFDGILLLRPELESCWDFRIFVEVSFEVALQRVLERDRELFGSPAEVEARYLQRYFPAQRQYLETVRPQERADAIVINHNPAQPKLRLH